MKRIQLTVIGRVVGVGFRYCVKSYAEKNNIKGYVKNLVDSSVEIVAEGERDEIDKMIEWIKSSPNDSNVKNIVISEYYGKEEFFDFQIRRI